MNKLKWFLQIFCLIMLITSCSGKKESAIQLNATQSDRLSVKSTCRIIQLETNPECVLGYLLKSYADLPNDRIFIISDFNLYFFNSAGKYLDKLKVGRGPGEINRIMAFTVNIENKLIYAIDDATKLCIFDYNGKMVANHDIKSFATCDLSLLDKDNVFLMRNYVGKSENNFIGIYNLPKKKVISKFIPGEKSPYPTNQLITAKNFSQNKGDTYFYAPNIFGLFEYRNADFQQILSFDLGGKAVPGSLSVKFEKEDQYKLREEAKSRQYIPFIIYAFAFKDHFFVGADDENINCYAIHRKNQKVYHNGPIYSYFNLPDKKSFRLPNGVQENLIIFQCSPSEFFDTDTNVSAKEIQVAGQNIKVNQTDNPFLLIVQ